MTGLIERDGRVAGVRAGDRDFGARLVVGADGRGSTVAKLVGARSYHTLPNQRFACWAYFEGAAWTPPAAAVLYRQDDHFVFGMPTDSALYLAAVVPGLGHLPAFRADPEARFAAHVAVSEPVAAIIGGAKRSGRLHFLSDYPMYFRESAGPGWVLVGDAGHFKDPAGAQGISDALRQAERLASAILESSEKALRRWADWRDRDAIEVHWFASDLGAEGRMSPVAIEMFKHLGATQAGRREFIDLLNHRRQPSQVLTPSRLVGASTRLLRRNQLPRRLVLAETGRLVRTDLGRRWRGRYPHYQAAEL